MHMGFFTGSKKMEEYEKRIVALEEENKLLSEAIEKMGKNIEGSEALLQVVLAAQQQLAYDINTMYDALQQVITAATKSSVDPLDEYLLRLNPFGSDDDDGGLLN